MSNGLGAGFAALTLLGVLGGIAVLATLSTVAAYAWVRRTGRLPGPFRYGFALLGVVVLGVTGFGVLALYDEAPACFCCSVCSRRSLRPPHSTAGCRCRGRTSLLRR